MSLSGGDVARVYSPKRRSQCVAAARTKLVQLVRAAESAPPRGVPDPPRHQYLEATLRYAGVERNALCVHRLFWAVTALGATPRRCLYQFASLESGQSEELPRMPDTGVPVSLAQVMALADGSADLKVHTG